MFTTSSLRPHQTATEHHKLGKELSKWNQHQLICSSGVNGDDVHRGVLGDWDQDRQGSVTEVT